jgi:hypothetical protein
MIDKEKIRQLIERGCGDRMDSEQTLRDSVIGGGLLEAMGWSFDKGEWTPNVAISFGTTTHHMDYWVGNEGSKWVLEAKNPINRIDRDKDVKELLSYMKQKDSQYGFLYNGKELLAFKLGSDLPFYEWSCDRNTEIFEMFSNDNFPSQLEQFITSQGALSRFQNYVKLNTSTIKNQIIDLVAENSQTPKEIVDQYFPFLISLFSTTEESTLPEPTDLESSTTNVGEGPVQTTSIDISDLINSGLIKPPLRIYRNYKGRTLNAEIIQGGIVRTNGVEYGSLSLAALKLTGTSINGWRWWLFKDDSGIERTLDYLRKKYLERRSRRS